MLTICIMVVTIVYVSEPKYKYVYNRMCLKSKMIKLIYVLTCVLW